MREQVDLQEELARWSATGLPRGDVVAALDHLVAMATEALADERTLCEALRRELVYSRCWPDGVGEQTLVSRAYLLMGPNRFPIPGDPEPVRQSLLLHEERLEALQTLIREANALRALLG